MVPSDHSHLEYETSIGDVLESYFEDVDHYLLSPFSESNSASATTTPCGVIMVGEVPGLPTTSSFDSISLDWEEEEEEEGSESIDNSVYESTTIRDVSFEFFKRGEPGLIECCQNRGSTTTPTQLPPLSRVPAFPLPPTPQRTPVLYFDPFDHSQSDTQEFNFNMIQQC
ncbi:uncharacterized protein KQ657_002388 [Scheffersomyces spartinae]|uniref:Uncharacterized protein n=1 Tax=Scheffersomyces spartinae TaxID=45513 RepID=A0A9P7V683_9ASCO|nr:uncharacterized protein KQ657_002388 [Scheffersomyces spartinae]KAG7192033.1 hypothetical protein KQ657_002388 [Scheffersomyces spartinae]